MAKSFKAELATCKRELKSKQQTMAAYEALATVPQPTQPQKVYECQKCRGKAFLSKNYLLAHYKRRHPTFNPGENIEPKVQTQAQSHTEVQERAAAASVAPTPTPPPASSLAPQRSPELEAEYVQRCRELQEKLETLETQMTQMTQMIERKQGERGSDAITSQHLAGLNKKVDELQRTVSLIKAAAEPPSVRPSSTSGQPKESKAYQVTSIYGNVEDSKARSTHPPLKIVENRSAIIADPPQPSPEFVENQSILLANPRPQPSQEPSTHGPRESDPKRSTLIQDSQLPPPPASDQLPAAVVSAVEDDAVMENAPRPSQTAGEKVSQMVDPNYEALSRSQMKARLARNIVCYTKDNQATMT